MQYKIACKNDSSITSQLHHSAKEKKHFFTHLFNITPSTMSIRIQVSNKRKSTSNCSVVEESPSIEEGDYATSSEEDEEASNPGFHKEDL